MFKISVPTPCHENWHQMSPTSKGAYCSSCSKEVIDFTSMTDDEVKHYLLNKKEEKLCGRFNQQQVNRIVINIPGYVFTRRIAGWKKFMAIVLIAFGSMLFGCDVHTNNLTRKATVTATTGTPILLGDTTYTLTGKEKHPAIDAVVIKTCSPLLGEVEFVSPPPMMGKVSFTPSDTTIMPITLSAIDSIIKTSIDSSGIKKTPADSANCSGGNYY